MKKTSSGSGPEVLQPPRLKNREKGEGSKFTIKTRAAIKVFAMSYSIWKPKRGIVQSTMASQVYPLETRQVLLQRSHFIRWEASTNLWVNWLQFLWERISLTHMWENEFKSKGWRFVSSSYNMVKLVLTLIKKGFIPTQNSMDQKLMQSVQNVETPKEPQYVVSTKCCRIQKEGAERRGLLCFWINTDKWILERIGPLRNCPHIHHICRTV